MYGYASSPIAFRDLVIVPVGGPGKSVMAFRQADGGVAWSRLDYGNVYSSPILINVSGLEQLAVLMDGALIAVNPHNGDQQWEVPFKANYAIAVATPVYGPDNLLFVSSEYDGGAKVIELQRQGLQTKATELWSNNPLPPPPRQRDAHRRGDLLLERRQGQPADPVRRRGAQRQDALAGAQHRQGDVRLGRQQARSRSTVTATLNVTSTVTGASAGEAEVHGAARCVS